MPVINAPSGVPAGFIAGWPVASMPNGWIKANGAAVSRTAYALLFAAIGTTYGAGDGSTTFNVPDMRGAFPRFLDDGRGVDSGRALNSWQSDAIRNITGSISTGVSMDNSGSGAIYSTPGVYSKAGAGGGSSYSAFGFDASRVVPISGENRPVNMPLIACIKY